MMSKLGGRCGGEYDGERGDDERDEGDLEFLLRRVRVRRRRDGMEVRVGVEGGVSVGGGVDVRVGDACGWCGLSGGPRSFFCTKILGGGLDAMLANGGQAASSIPSGLTLLSAAPEVSTAA